MASYRLSVDYLSRTADGRILFGGRGAPYRFGSTIEAAFDRDARTHALLREMVEAWFPSLRGIGFGHAWGGPLGMPRDWIPTFSFDPRSGVASGRGYTGHGVSTANLAGRVLAGLIRGESLRADHPAPGQPPLPELGARALPLDRRAVHPGVAPSARRPLGPNRQAADGPLPGGAHRQPLTAPGPGSGPRPRLRPRRWARPPALGPAPALGLGLAHWPRLVRRTPLAGAVAARIVKSFSSRQPPQFVRPKILIATRRGLSFATAPTSLHSSPRPGGSCVGCPDPAERRRSEPCPDHHLLAE